MDLHTSASDIKVILDCLLDAQHNHIEAFGRDSQAEEMDRHNQERNVLYASLKQAIVPFLRDVELSENRDLINEMLRAMELKISQILEQTDELTSLTTARRDMVKQQMQKLSSGKRILKSYAPSAQHTSRPRVVRVSE